MKFDNICFIRKVVIKHKIVLINKSEKRILLM